MANCSQWELRSSEPVDAAGKQTGQGLSLLGHVPKVADPYSRVRIKSLDDWVQLYRELIGLQVNKKQDVLRVYLGI